MIRCYAGIGSRDTPNLWLAVMKSFATSMAESGWQLRSGGAPGADQAFELGSRMVTTPWEDLERETAEVFLPWDGFEGRFEASSDPFTRYHPTPQYEAYAIAAQYHPNWYGMSQGSRRLHARNVHQVLGSDVTKPVLPDFVICWTPGGKGGGGTGQAIRIASAHGVPIFDMARDDDFEKAHELVEEANERGQDRPGTTGPTTGPAN